MKKINKIDERFITLSLNYNRDFFKRVTTCDWFQTTEIWTSKSKTMYSVL